jgi:hypothetical protein
MLNIDEQRARNIAAEDAKTAYRDLSEYEVTAHLKGDSWYVDYLLRDKSLVGGGPHYVISATSGEILQRRYEQ